MSFIGRLFGSEKAISSAVDSVSKGLDALVYTDEEKSIDNAKSITEARQMLIEWIKASQGSNLARRIIALSVTFSWLLMYFTSMCLNVASVFVNPADTQKAATIIGDYADGMNGAVMMVLLYYFAAPHMGQGIQAALDKFGKKTPTA
jgi:hypothetical protein